MSNLVPVSDLEKMASAVARSNLFGIKTTEQAMALMLIAQAEGLHPAIAARDYHVIQGKPSLKADAMMARFQTAGGSVKWTEYSDTRVAGVFSHPQGGSVELDWTIEKARQLGFLSKDTWKNYPRAMMRARCISEGIRTVFPGCVVGVYTPEEVQDFDAPQAPKDMGPAEVVQPEKVPEPMPESIIVDHIAKMDEATEMPELQKAFADAITACAEARDMKARDRFVAAKDKRKNELQQKAA